MTFSFKIEGVSDLFVARGGRLFYPVILGKGHWKSYGGEGNFRTAGIFFVIKFLVWIFLAIAWIFVRINWRAWIFFYLIFPCANIFLYFARPPISFPMVRPLSIVFDSVDSVVPGGGGRTLRIMAYGYAPPIRTLRGLSVLTGLNL